MSDYFRSFVIACAFALVVASAASTVRGADGVTRVKRHERAIKKLHALGAELVLTTVDSSVISTVDDARARDLFDQGRREPTIYVPMVTLTKESHTPEVIRSMIPHLRRIIPKKGQNVAGMSFIGIVIEGNPALTMDLETELKNKLPNCRLSHDVEFHAEVDRVLATQAIQVEP